MPKTDDRNFLVGETIVSNVQVNKPGTSSPIDPASVTLTSLSLGSVVQPLPPVTAYTRLNTGQYRLNINSTGMAPGTYKMLVTVEAPAPVNPGDPQGAVILPDSFVLSSP